MTQICWGRGCCVFVAGAALWNGTLVELTRCGAGKTEDEHDWGVRRIRDERKRVLTCRTFNVER
jgi:hypothetical protein